MKRYYYILFCLFIPVAAQAQWINYTHYDRSPLLVNPAAMALRTEVQVNTTFRSQAIGESNRVAMGSVSLLKAITAGRGVRQVGTVGGTIIQQTAGPQGVLSTTGVMANYSYLVRFKKGYYLSMGIQAGAINRRINTDVFYSENQFQGTDFNLGLPIGENIENASRIYPTFGSGLTWFYQDGQGETRAWLGAAAFNINNPDQSFTALKDEMPIRILVTGGAALLPQEDFAIIPNIRLVHEASSNLVHVGSWFRYYYNNAPRFGHVGGGLWVSPENSIAASFEYSTGLIVLGIGAEIPYSTKYDNMQVANGIEASISWNPGKSLVEKDVSGGRKSYKKRKPRRR